VQRERDGGNRKNRDNGGKKLGEPLPEKKELDVHSCFEAKGDSGSKDWGDTQTSGRKKRHDARRERPVLKRGGNTARGAAYAH